MRTYVANVTLESNGPDGTARPTVRSTIGPVTREGFLNFLAAALVDIPHPKYGQVYKATVEFITTGEP